MATFDRSCFPANPKLVWQKCRYNPNMDCFPCELDDGYCEDVWLGVVEGAEFLYFDGNAKAENAHYQAGYFQEVKNKSAVFFD